jgi:Protein of unknown function (DUF4240)
MTTTLRVNLRDINLQFFKDLEEKAGASAQVEIRVESSKHGEGLFTEEQFWQLIELFDWKQKKRADIIQPAVTALSKMPVSAIYLFEDFLSKKLFDIDTREHAKAYMNQQTDDYFSVDDFLYVRCAAVAEGREYYEKIKNNPSELSPDIDFEHILSVAADAYKRKTGRDFEYSPLYNYETKSNVEKWQ